VKSLQNYFLQKNPSSVGAEYVPRRGFGNIPGAVLYKALAPDEPILRVNRKDI
jgi:hypothetical protein